MIRSVLRQGKTTIVLTVLLLLSCLCYGFKPGFNEQQWLTWSNRCLSESFDPTTEPGLKKFEISLTDTHFFRLRKTYQQGNQVYYSFYLQRLKSVDYIDTAGAYQLQLNTNADDIIMQTFDDPGGDVDSLLYSLNVPVKKLSPERVDSLKEAISYFKSKEL